MAEVAAVEAAAEEEAAGGFPSRRRAGPTGRGCRTARTTWMSRSTGSRAQGAAAMPSRRLLSAAGDLT